jgi:uncharacterized C2H2 Zn-finger protein
VTATPNVPGDPTPVGRDEELFVSCKTCGFLIATGLRAPATSLEEADLPARRHRCPRCGAAHPYAREDYRYRG